MKYGGEEQTKRTKMKNKQKNILICLKNKKTAVQKILPQGTEKPVAGLQPVSRQRMETILPSEKEEGSSVETKNNKAYFNHTAGSQLPKQTCKKYRKKKKNHMDARTQILKKKTGELLFVVKITSQLDLI